MQALLSSQISTLACARSKRARRSQCVRATAERPYGIWFPNAEIPPWLDGSMPGDFGFDPLGLASDNNLIGWYRQAELLNGRWAMIGCVGVLAAELFNAQSAEAGYRWWEVGASPQPYPIRPLLAVELAFFSAVENLRFQAWKKGETTFIDFGEFSTKGDMQVKELKNGRLAMIAFAGYFVQAVITQEGPLAGARLHLADPLGYNITTNVGNISQAVMKYYPDQPMLAIDAVYDSYKESS